MGRKRKSRELARGCRFSWQDFFGGKQLDLSLTRMQLPPGHVTSKAEWSLKRQLSNGCTCKGWQATACPCNGYCACHYKEQLGKTRVNFDANCLASALYDANQPALVYAGEHWEAVQDSRVALPVFENIPEGTLAQGLEEKAYGLCPRPFSSIFWSKRVSLPVSAKRKCSTVAPVMFPLPQAQALAF